MQDGGEVCTPGRVNVSIYSVIMHCLRIAMYLLPIINKHGCKGTGPPQFVSVLADHIVGYFCGFNGFINILIVAL